MGDIFQMIFSHGYPRDPFTVLESTQSFPTLQLVLPQIQTSQVDAEGNVVDVGNGFGTESEGARG